MRTAAIIPAYNEAARIGAVLEIVTKVTEIDEIIVVNDGSQDETAAVARLCPHVRLIEMGQNVGKGGAMWAGIKATMADTLLFLDADLIGLSPSHVHDLLYPVLSGQALTSVGIFSSGRFLTDLAQKLTPFLSGQRAIHRDILTKIPNLDFSKYGVEVALTRHLHELGISSVVVPLKDMSHVMKEEKLGFFQGFKARLKMYWDIVRWGLVAK